MNKHFLLSIILSIFICYGFSQTRGPKNGTLLIIGGYASDSIYLSLFSELTGGYDSPIVVIPTARDDESLSNMAELTVCVWVYPIDYSYTDNYVVYKQNSLLLLQHPLQTA